MNKIKIIIIREYLVRIRKKSFFVMTILGPVLIAALFILPIWFSSLDADSDKVIAVIDKSHRFQKALQSNDNTKFVFLADSISLQEVKNNFDQLDYYAVVEIPDFDQEPASQVLMYSTEQPSMNVKNSISNSIERELKNQRLAEKGLQSVILDSLSVNINLNTKQLNHGQEKTGSTEMSMLLGFFLSLLVYIFIFMYGTQVMRGVIEEKTNRVVEIIISSVRPFQLMLGKILGIALVVLTQFTLWVILSTTFIMLAKAMLLPNIPLNSANAATTMMQNPQSIPLSGGMGQMLYALFSLPFGMLAFSFVFYFVGGYLLYASMFAAVGSAVDSEADIQQFMLPVTLPLILSIVMTQFFIQNPNGSLAVWFSLIPFTSPVVMMVRMPFNGVKSWELVLSMFFLVVSFLLITWLAAKIYRTGILMYGKKITYKDLWKWIRPSKKASLQK